MSLRVASFLLLAAAAPLAGANDFPTTARVEFVLDCMQQSKAPPRELLYKCSCAIDTIAKQITYDEWVDLSTIANAISIAGERGGPLRDMKDGRKRASAFRDLQNKAKKACFIDD
jgi:hypothetical protein